MTAGAYSFLGGVIGGLIGGLISFWIAKFMARQQFHTAVYLEKVAAYKAIIHEINLAIDRTDENMEGHPQVEMDIASSFYQNCVDHILFASENVVSVYSDFQKLLWDANSKDLWETRAKLIKAIQDDIHLPEINAAIAEKVSNTSKKRPIVSQKTA